MPTFDYQCHSCGVSFEVFLLPREKDMEVVCAACSSTEVERQISAPSVVYKARGYYSTDAASSAPPTPSPSDTGCGGGCSCH